MGTWSVQGLNRGLPTALPSQHYSSCPHMVSPCRPSGGGTTPGRGRPPADRRTRAAIRAPRAAPCCSSRSPLSAWPSAHPLMTRGAPNKRLFICWVVCSFRLAGVCTGPREVLEPSPKLLFAVIYATTTLSIYRHRLALDRNAGE